MSIALFRPRDRWCGRGRLLHPHISLVIGGPTMLDALR